MSPARQHGDAASHRGAAAAAAAAAGAAAWRGPGGSGRTGLRHWGVAEVYVDGARRIDGRCGGRMGSAWLWRCCCCW